ncbi:hypothetical protein LP420_38305 [Massilia sp. B-10]|nr:hypothetical protein LP420_38305 [Massilia sp. B-10]
MVPGQRFDKPGKSPFMDMQLVPVYAWRSGRRGQGRHQRPHAAKPGLAHRRSGAGADPVHDFRGGQCRLQRARRGAGPGAQRRLRGTPACARRWKWCARASR